MRYRVKEDVCDGIKEGDEVSIIPSYSYMIGSSERIKDYFKLKQGEVVISKVQMCEISCKQKMAVAKCEKSILEKVE